jgi:hypothetical protein
LVTLADVGILLALEEVGNCDLGVYLGHDVPCVTLGDVGTSNLGVYLGRGLTLITLAEFEDFCFWDCEMKPMGSQQ